VLYIKNGVKVERLVGGGEQERGMRGGTLNVANIVGLAEAYKNARRDMEENNAKAQDLSAYFLSGLETIGGITRNGAGATALPSVLNLRIEGVENVAFLFNMDLSGVCLSAGSACSSASLKPSHVLKAMGLTDEEAKESVRFSLGKRTTKAELDETLRLMRAIVTRLR
jgi:cysteine desulfurase